mmetsp:Transcript_10634/g.23064  ORF Transcript_10634/g.23064 Transcript_10634/m.23064 type:complete len:768 (+) Transcript_10634:2-2305(+)
MITTGAYAAIVFASALLALLTVAAVDRLRHPHHHRESHQIQRLLQQVSELQARVDAVAYVPGAGRELQVSCDLPSGFTYASSFGVVGDASADDGPALQSAIDSAASDLDAGGIVVLPRGTFRTNEPLVVPAGVTLQGQGYGSSPLAIQFDAGGSVVAYCGTDHAVKLAGHGAGLRDLAVYDWPYDGCGDVRAAGGVLIDADGHGVESAVVNNVLIYYFTGGTALSLVARNNAGIAYGNYQNLRIRHAKTGIYLSAEEGSFVNTNSFVGGAISGGAFDSCLYAHGPGACNDNKFYGMSIEPGDSDLAHVYITGSKTNVRLHDIRLEATDKALDRPIVIVDDSSYGNVMNGMLGHTHIQANLNRNPGIDFTSQKSAGLDPAPVNRFWNAAFKGWDGPNRKMPGWKLDGTNADITTVDDSEALYPDHKIIHVDKLSYGGAFKLLSDETLHVPGHDMATFGVYARSSASGSISAVMRYASGSIISSASHSGSGEWEFIGMSALYDHSAPYFYFSITGDVELTAPTLTFGGSPATPGASLMSSSGARMSGTLTLGATIGLPPNPATPYYWVLPKDQGNVFLMDMQDDPNRQIIRLNHSGADRFPRGTIITMMFAEAGTRIQDNSYIQLKDGQDFVSVEHSSITLFTEGGATWTEVSRNGGAPLPVGPAAGLPPDPTLNTPYYWVLPKDQGNVFLMDMQGDPNRMIIRLNHSGADRFPRGTIITMMFEEAGTRIKDNGYIKLKGGQDFVSVEHSSITLLTEGGASWTEVSRNV